MEQISLVIPPMMLLAKPLRPPKILQLTADQFALLMPIGDIHAGHPGCSLTRLKRHLEWGMERGAYFLGMGDYFDFGSASQMEILKRLRDSTQAELEKLLLAQLEELACILRLATGRWLGLLGGNHDFVGPGGVSMGQRLAGELGTHWLGCETVALLRVRLGHFPQAADILIAAHHGMGGGRLAGSGLLAIERMLSMFPDTDIYLQAHNHTKVNAPLDAIYLAPNGKEYHRTKLLARTGSWLRGYQGGVPFPTGTPHVQTKGSYISSKLLPPAALGGLVIGLGRKYDERAKLWIPDIHYAV